MNSVVFIHNKCPECLELFQKIDREFGFLFDEFHGFVKDCKADQYGCDILINVEGVGIRFETSPRDGIEFANGIILPVEDPSNKLNRPHSISTIIDFIENAPPSKYQGPDWSDHRFYNPTDFKNALQRVIAFYKSPEFVERSRKFNEWYEWQTEEFIKSVNDYYRSHS